MYTKTNLNKWLELAPSLSWNELVELINVDIGFITAADEEVKFFVNLHTITIKPQSIKFSFKNLVNADRIITPKCTFENIKIVDVKRRPTKKKLNGKRVVLLIDEYTIQPAGSNAEFTCPACNNMYVVDLVPARCLSRRTGLCKPCQKKLVHKTPSYRACYEQSMLTKYGVRRPIQNPAIREEMRKTMKIKHGVNYAMQSTAVREKHALNMQRRHGISNWFEGKNSFIEGWTSTSPISNIERKFVEQLSASCTGIQMYTALNKQYCVNTGSVIMFPDVYIPAAKLVIEFNGDFWHANSNIYNITDQRSLFNGMNAAAIHERDRKRSELMLETLGSDHLIHVVWEYDFRHDPEAVVTNCIELINERIAKYVTH